MEPEIGMHKRWTDARLGLHLSACTICVAYIVLVALCNHQITCVVGSHIQACYDPLRQPFHVTCSTSQTFLIGQIHVTAMAGLLQLCLAGRFHKYVLIVLLPAVLRFASHCECLVSSL